MSDLKFPLNVLGSDEWDRYIEPKIRCGCDELRALPMYINKIDGRLYPEPSEGVIVTTHLDVDGSIGWATIDIDRRSEHGQKSSGKSAGKIRSDKR